LSAAPQFPHDFRWPEEQPEQPPQQPPLLPRRALWKRLLRGFAILVGLLVILIAIAIPVLLHSVKFHQYVLNKARTQASTALGTDVAIRDFGLTFSGISPTLDVYNVRVAGAAPYNNTPLLTVDHARVGVRIVSLLHRKWYLSDVEVHRPVVNVFVGKNGSDNLPKTKKNSSSQSKTNIFDLAVQHAVLDGGEVYYNSRKADLSADLHNVDFRSGFDNAQRKYSGTLSYENGHLRIGKYNPLPHALNARFDLTPDRFTLQDATLVSGNSHVVLNAIVNDLSNPKLDADYNASIDAGEFRRVLKNSTLPLGTIQLVGHANYDNPANLPPLKVAKLTGTLSSSALEVRTPTLRTVIRDIGASYQLNAGNAEVRDLHAGILGGLLAGELTVRDVSGASDSRLDASLHHVQLAAAKALMNSASLQQVNLTGGVDANATATWGRNMSRLAAKADAALHGGMAPQSNPAQRVPLDGVIHARYAGASKTLALSQSYVRLPQTLLDMNGTISDRSALQLRLQANDLHELETISNLFRKPTPGQPATPMGLYGVANFNGEVRGTTTAPELTGLLQASNLRIKGSAWRLLRTNVLASPSVASVQNGELDPAGQGHIRFNLKAGLRHWSFTPESPIEIGLDAGQLNLADLAKAAGSTTPVTGVLSANVHAHGSELNPQGQGNISLANAKIAGETIKAANVNFNGTGDALHTTAELRLPAGVANAVVTFFPKERGYDAQLHANGIRLDQLQAVKAKGMQLAGVLNLNASGKGTLDDPSLNASLQIPKLQVQKQTIDNLSLQANVADRVANIALDSQAVNTFIRGRARVALDSNYTTNATFDTGRIPFQPLVAAYAPSQAGNVTGQTELHATLRGPLKNKKLMEAHVTVPVLSANYKNTIQIGAAQPIHLDYVDGVADLQRTEIRGTGTELRLQARVPVTTNAPASMLAQGSMDLQLAQLLDPEIASSGTVRFNVNSYGQRQDPNVQGTIEIVNANVATGSTPVGLENGNGLLTLTTDRLNITRFTGVVGGGQVSAGGGIVYRPALNFDLALSGNGIRVLVPPGVRTGIGMDLTMTGNMSSAALRGQVHLDQLSFTPDFDLSELMGSFGGTASAPPSQGFANDLQLNLVVNSPNGINLVSRDLSLQGNTNLQVRGTAAEPVVLGRVNVNDGDLLFRGNRYLLQSGTIDFVNPVRTEPVLNVGINTTVQQYDIAMRFEGPIDKMRTNYTSDPALPPADIINLLAFGKTSEASAANPNPPGNLAAESAVASAVSGQVTNRIEKIAGISHLSVDPTLGGNQQNPGATVTIQQRVTGKIFVTFSTDVTATQREVIQLEYKKSPRLSFSGTRDQNGGFAVDTKIRKTW
jgi:translocation and assembly module TamB